MITVVCQDCSKQELRYQPSVVGKLCYSCESDLLEREGLWLDPAGGLHSIDEEDSAGMYE